MALGNILKEARMRKNLTASEVAADTRMKIQLVHAIEKEDFAAFPATIYGKGFIKLFAELVDVDPIPLLEEYINTVNSGSLTQPAPTPTRKPRKILMDTEPEIDDSNNIPTNTEENALIQPELPITEEKLEQKPEANTKPIVKEKDLFSEIEAEEKETTMPLFYPEEKTVPLVETISTEEHTTLKEAQTTIEIDPQTKQKEIPVPAPITKQEPVIEQNKEEKKEEPIVEEIPVISQAQLNTTRTTEKSLPSSTPASIKERASNISLNFKKLNLSESHIKTAWISIVVLILLIFILSSISRCSRNKENLTITTKNTPLQLAMPPAAPYLE